MNASRIRQVSGDFRKCAHQTANAGYHLITSEVKDLRPQLQGGWLAIAKASNDTIVPVPYDASV